MNKFLLFLFAAIFGLWVYLRPDQVISCIDNVKVWLGYAPPTPPTPATPEVPQPPPGIYFLSERVSAMTDNGIRSIPKGTEVRLISQRDSTATVEDGRGEFQVDFYKLSRDYEIRGESHLGIQSAARTYPPDPGNASNAGANSTVSESRRVIAKRIAEVEAGLLESMDTLRTLSSNDPVKGRKIEDINAANVVQGKIAALETELSKLKAELAKTP